MTRGLIADRTVATVAAAALFLSLVSCVTINVYFPAAAIKDLSRQIEDEVEKKAAENPNSGAANPNAPDSGNAKPAEPKPPEKPRTARSIEPRSVTAGLVESLLGVTPAYAAENDVAAPEISSPAIRAIIESRAARVGTLNDYKGKGAIGENNKGLVEARSLDSLADLKARAEVQRLVKAENIDREQLFKEIAAAKGVELSQLPKIRETYATTLREKARTGDWIQDPGGAWRRK